MPTRLVELERLVALRHVGPAPEFKASAIERPHQLRRRFDEEQTARIVEGYASGKTAMEIGQTYGASRNGIIAILKDQGVILRRRPLSDEQLSQAVQLYRTGASIQRIADRFDVSYGCVRQALQRAGVPRRPRGGSYK